MEYLKISPNNTMNIYIIATTTWPEAIGLIAVMACFAWAIWNFNRP